MTSEHILKTSRTLRHFPNNVEGPIGERPRIGDHFEGKGWFMNMGRLFLAPYATFGVVFGLFDHLWPSVPLS